MKNNISTVSVEPISNFDASRDQGMMMGSLLVGFNLLLMIGVTLYWTNTTFHCLISGKPL